MRKNRLLLSLMFALTYGAVACGGAEDSLSDSTESLRRGSSSADGGVRGTKKPKHEHDGGDVDEDSDETADESADGGKHHDRVSHERGDGGTCVRGGGKRGGRGDEDSDEQGDEGGKGGLGGLHLDGGVKQGGKPGHDAGH